VFAATRSEKKNIHNKQVQVAKVGPKKDF
jgi:hypothetical protein